MVRSKRLVVTLAVAAVLIVTGCGDDDAATTEPTPTAGATATAAPTATPTTDPTPTTTPLPDPTVTTTAAPEPTPSPEPEPTATPAPTPDPTATAAPGPTPTPTVSARPAPALTVNVYWAMTIDTTPGGSPERIAAGGRVRNTFAPARAALEALLEGPNALETEIGMTSAIPSATTLLGVTITGGIATVDLSGDFEQGSGTLAETLRVAQVVFTLTQFDSVDTVRFRIDGEPREFLASHGIDVSDPVDRDDFENVRPFILVERPYPGASFQSGDTITGESNTFEATVEYAITDPEGLIIAEGFTTASGGNGIWGRFTIPVILDTEASGRGAVIVFETSARDGSQIHVVEYPIELVGA